MVNVKQTYVELLKAYIFTRQQKNNYETLFQDAPIGIATVTKNGELTSANPYFCNMLGYTQDELILLTITDITHPEDIIKENEKIAKMRDMGLSSIHFEKRYRKKNGEYVWADLVTSSVKNCVGNSSCGLGMIFDITERKKLEAEKNELINELQESLQKIKNTVRTSAYMFLLS